MIRPDHDTVAYFDEHTPEYGEARVEAAIEIIGGAAGAEPTLIDIGCGTGNTLDHIMRETSIREAAGLDVSPAYLEMVSNRLGCETYQGSILDRDFIATIERRFDYALVSAILHHLIGRTRSESKGYAALAVSNTASLLKPGGTLIVQEPVYYPPSAASLLFYAKKAVTRVTKRRVPVFGYWNNLGAPVVSYYTNEVLFGLIEDAGLEIKERIVEPAAVPALLRPLLRKTNTTVAAAIPRAG